MCVCVCAQRFLFHPTILMSLRISVSASDVVFLFWPFWFQQLKFLVLFGPGTSLVQAELTDLTFDPQSFFLLSDPQPGLASML